MKNRFIRSFALLGGAALFCHWQNNDLVTTRYQIRSPKLPKAFDGYKIVQISDLHNKKFGLNQSALLEKVMSEKPDLIVVTGDLIDRSRTDVEAAMAFIRGAVQIARVAYVSGNHEVNSGINMHLAKKLASAGVEVLNDKATDLLKQEQKIRLIGMSDFSYCYSRFSSTPRLYGNVLKSLASHPDQRFQILLSHRPELLPLYARCGMDLAFCGHAHGGQIRLPLVGALFAPNQGIFPEYTSGVHQAGRTHMIVSRGLGNSRFPLRIFNRPEIVSVVLKAGK